MDRTMTHIYRDVREFNADLGKKQTPSIVGQGISFQFVTQAMVRSLFDYNPNTGDLTLKSTGKPAIKSGNGFGGHLYVVIGMTRHAAAKVIWLWFYGERKNKVTLIDKNKGFRINNLIVAK